MAQGSLLLGSLLFGLLLASAGITSICPRDSGIGVGINLLHVGGDGLELVFGDGGGSWEDLAGDLVRCGGGLHLSGSSVVDQTLLSLAILSWEQDELGFVGVESLSVQLELLLAGGGSSVVDGDSDGASKGSAETSGLELSKGETTAVSDLTSVPSGAAGHDGSEHLGRPGEHFTAFLLSALQSSELLRWLVEVDSDARLPVLAEMYVWDDVVVLDHC